MAGLRRVTTTRAGRGGFSLLEVVITIAILTSVCLATTLLLVPVARQSRIGRETETANLAANRVLERIQSTPFRDIISSYPQGSEQAVAELPNGKIKIIYEDPAADPLVIQADLSWESVELGPMSRTFNTVRTE